uniref:Uncharacterized protein n=1 Tax=Gasterosteus aculeatus TaxID=69293 RepID=G3PSA0_GASAC
GCHRSALSVSGPRAEERRHQQTSGVDRQHAVCVRKNAASRSLTADLRPLTSSPSFQEVACRRSSNPQSVCDIVPGSPGARHGDHGDVRPPRCPV